MKQIQDPKAMQSLRGILADLDHNISGIEREKDI